MENKKKLQRYYTFGLLPILIVWALISIFVDPMFGIFFLIGYTWPYMYYTPGFEDKARSKSYRFSLLGNLFRFQEYIFSLLPSNPRFWMKPLARLVVPFLLSGVLSILNPSWSPLWTFMGWVVFEVFVFLDKKMQWNLLE